MIHLAQPSEDQEHQVRHYTHWVTGVMVLLCNGVLLLGLWGSGLNLERLIRTPDQFDPTKHICLRPIWQKVSGIAQPVRICDEWIDLTDPSGQTHTLARETEVVQGANGRLYLEHGPLVDYRLFLLGTFTIGVIASGAILERYLIARYRMRLGIGKPKE